MSLEQIAIERVQEYCNTGGVSDICEMDIYHLFDAYQKQSDELTRLRAELDAVKAERDEAKGIIKAQSKWESYQSWHIQDLQYTITELKSQLYCARQWAAAWKMSAQMWRAASPENYRTQARRYKFQKPTHSPTPEERPLRAHFPGDRTQKGD